MKDPKQVIVVRKDLNMRKGKIAAQVAHASMKVLLDMMVRRRLGDSGYSEISFLLKDDSSIDRWLSQRFTKVVVGVDSKEELEEIFRNAQSSSIPCSYIIDAGLTEFGGVPTATCAAIGPFDAEVIDEVSGHLKLL
jgi:PTH2 family peptidyl-tRNA hydrolase